VLQQVTAFNGQCMRCSNFKKATAKSMQSLAGLSTGSSELLHRLSQGVPVLPMQS